MCDDLDEKIVLFRQNGFDYISWLGEKALCGELEKERVFFCSNEFNRLAEVMICFNEVGQEYSKLYNVISCQDFVEA